MNICLYFPPGLGYVWSWELSMVCGIGERKKKTKSAKYIRKHLTRSAGSYLKPFPLLHIPKWE